MYLNTNEIIEFITSKTHSNAEQFTDRFPFCTVNGKYTFRDDGFWTGSFWCGINYVLSSIQKNPVFIDYARAPQYRLKERMDCYKETLDHDIGMLFSLSYVADYKLTGNEESKEIALQAAKLLSQRYHEKGQFIQAWPVWDEKDAFCRENSGRFIADCMYNLPLLFWASSVTGDRLYATIAENHAKTTAKYLIRADFTAYHTFVMDPETGLPRYGKTFQGYAGSSCWSRGQGWLLGGYAYAYRYTGYEDFLKIAMKCADVFIQNLESDFVPMWDFRLPTKVDEPRDTSAAAIGAAGIIEIASHLTGDMKSYYINIATKIIQSLYASYSTKDTPEDEGLLLHACGHKPQNAETDCSLIYGDYYFTEAVARLAGMENSLW